MKIIELEGSRRDMGLQMGSRCRDEIRGLYDARLDNAIRQALFYGRRRVEERQLLAIAERCLPYLERWDPLGHSELAGVAEGARMSLARVWMMNALTDIRDLAAYGEPDWARPIEEGCSAILVSAGRSDAGPLLGQTWDLSTDNMPFVRLVVRRPAAEPATASMTLVGCASLVGVNSRGVAIGTTNVRATDNRLGVGYLDVIHRGLHQGSASAAVDFAKAAPRAGAHFYFMADPASDPVALECTAHIVGERTADDVYVHTNHMLHDATKKLEARGTPTASSHARQRRLESLVAATERLGVADLQRLLSDREGGAEAVERHDFAGISTNGAVVMEPAARRIHAVWGPPSRGTWISYAL